MKRNILFYEFVIALFVLAVIVSEDAEEAASAFR